MDDSSHDESEEPVIDASAVEDTAAAAEAPAAVPPPLETDDDIDAIDALQPELFAIFEEEAEELFGKLANRLQDWSRSPDDAQHGAGAMRDLHTLKGAARLAGAMRLGVPSCKSCKKASEPSAQPVSAARVRASCCGGETPAPTKSR